MDGDERRRQQYGTPYQPPTSTRATPSQQMPPPPPVADRYTQPLQSPARAEATRLSLNRPSVASYGAYPFQEQQYGAQPAQGSPMQGVDTQYTSTYFNDPARQQQQQQQQQQIQQQSPTQGYGYYGQSLVMPQAQTQSVYDPGAPHQQRQSTAIEVLANQFGMPQYLPTAEHGGVLAAAASSQYLTSQAEQSAFPHEPASARTPVVPTYPTASSAYASTQQTESQGVADPGPAQEALEESRRQYQQQLGLAFDAVRSGRVTEASHTVLELSRWLLTNVQELGLHHDNPEEHASRLEFWQEFNLCWEALGQKQKDITEEALRLRQQPADVLSASSIRHLVDQLISLCDQVEPYGLVDYDMGVWEEQIVHIFSQCLDLLSPDDRRSSAASAAAVPSTR